MPVFKIYSYLQSWSAYAYLTLYNFDLIFHNINLNLYWDTQSDKKAGKKVPAL